MQASHDNLPTFNTYDSVPQRNAGLLRPHPLSMATYWAGLSCSAWQAFTTGALSLPMQGPRAQSGMRTQKNEKAGSCLNIPCATCSDHIEANPGDSAWSGSGVAF
jgi:hypothetical protein